MSDFIIPAYFYLFYNYQLDFVDIFNQSYLKEMIIWIYLTLLFCHFIKLY